MISHKAAEIILNQQSLEGIEIKRTEQLWQRETRVGIGIDHKTRRTDMADEKGGQLYMATHIRMAEKTCLYITLNGWSGDTHPFARSTGALTPLGGEHRMAQVKEADSIQLPDAPKDFEEKDGKIRYLVWLISPCVLDTLDQVGGLLHGTVVSACLGKPQKIGGWDSGYRTSIPSRPALPPGSVWFVEADKSEQDKILELHGSHIGVGSEWGFGQILIGKW